MAQKLCKILLTIEQAFYEALTKMIQSSANIKKAILGPFQWVGIPRWFLGFLNCVTNSLPKYLIQIMKIYEDKGSHCLIPLDN